VKQEIYLEPIGTEVIFAAPRALRVDVRAGAVNVDDMGSIAVPTAAARLFYVVESELEAPPPAGTRVAGTSAGLDAGERRRYLQLPPLSPSVVRLAADVTAGSRDPYEAAVRLSHFLSTNYRYSLSKKETPLDPLDEFLFGRRAGNCEYFSAALAVMLRAQDIPARVVGGFQRGEWNPYGRYFMVRLSDAHAWVEAYFEGLGWLTFDPSPRAEDAAQSAPWALTMYLDAARMRWYRYVVNWSLQDQRVMVSAVQRHAHDFRLALSWPRDWGGRSWLAVAGGAVGLIGLGALLWRLGAGRRAGAPVFRVPRFYAQALLQLERSGLSLAPAETARQFCSRVGAAAPTCAGPFARITGAYERARFGAAELSEADLSDVERSLAELSSQSGRRTGRR
jgi:transglutaminase-like putative cysteine protease